ILRDLVAVPIQRLRNAAGRAARVGLDVSGVDGIVETDPELLDLLSRPRPKRQLTVRRVGNAAWRTLLARAERAGMRIVRNAALGVGEVVVVRDGVRPVPGYVRLPVACAGPGPFSGFDDRIARFPARFLGRRVIR